MPSGAPWIEPNGQYATYNANCHCGHTKYTVRISPPLDQGNKVTECNCSICSRNRYATVYPFEGDVKFICGFEDLGRYNFGNGVLPHLFCKQCGSSIGVDLLKLDEIAPGSGKRYAINVRMIKDIDMDKMEVKKIDGKSFLPPYET